MGQVHAGNLGQFAKFADPSKGRFGKLFKSINQWVKLRWPGVRPEILWVLPCEKLRSCPCRLVNYETYGFLKDVCRMEPDERPEVYQRQLELKAREMLRKVLPSQKFYHVDVVGLPPSKDNGRLIPHVCVVAYTEEALTQEFRQATLPIKEVNDYVPGSSDHIRDFFQGRSTPPLLLEDSAQ